MGVVGEKVGPFEIVEPVWVPDPGRWYRARASTGEEALVRAAGSERYDREAVARQWDVLGQITDPRVPTVLAHDPKRGLLAVSPAIGTPLSDAIEQRADESVVLTPATLLDVVLQLARAIEAAHDAGVVHGQLDPEQVVLTPTGDLYVFGFGTVRAPGKGWIPPEVARGHQATEATDRWSVAAIAAGLVLGRPMWDDPAEAEAGDVSTAVELIRRQWASLGEVLGAMLSREPEDRPTGPDVVSLLEELAALAGPDTERVELGDLLWSRRAAFMNPADGGAPTAVPPTDASEEASDPGPGARPVPYGLISVVPADRPPHHDRTLEHTPPSPPRPSSGIPIVRVAPVLAALMVVTLLVWFVTQLL